jgi:hypothetical protein
MCVTVCSFADACFVRPYIDANAVADPRKPRLTIGLSKTQYPDVPVELYLEDGDVAIRNYMQQEFDRLRSQRRLAPTITAYAETFKSLCQKLVPT